MNSVIQPFFGHSKILPNVLKDLMIQIILRVAKRFIDHLSWEGIHKILKAYMPFILVRLELLKIILAYDLIASKNEVIFGLLQILNMGRNWSFC